ncbi:nucleotidyl transferase AbiEii/AbiGii toxin family protein [Hydrogenimonas thermophila]|uniref:nucleotidyl transferase AbiEii/AbiGii toxin family protein n=1 Tax=Hydrogenimonas thermophila TaxID=223786 RepID=UPI0029372F99|nr:nucleotidyl transferase AbiEii/AbiGii toxin family protein [Hydrogenimonas thermophila]WOE69026.1 nucleotidyl transferase AbiEii/AbiGii toxin family protein [Hydrogenimonas thermophila]WOE71536.1 nucleotidyl transferase AbiEii/AbiGii toxin family protein [Hydrogenimonas thermophila]
MQDLKNLDCLLPKTRALLLKMIEDCHFLDKYVLVGGSALSLHLCHRKSEDLDFFTFNNSFDKQEIFTFVKRFENKEILNQTDEQIDLLIDGVKVTFFNAKWKFLEPEKPMRFNLAPIEAIAAMKVNVLFLRAKFRDYYDLYFLVKKSMALQEIYQESLNVVEGLNFKLFAVALLYIDDIEDDNIGYLEPIESLDKRKIRDFFEYKLNQIKC